ncbi:hypothetical protein BC829DRAFT_409660 [Chytridium lagenaria]|nr:hypothetical protein BC829DRAFT_409660 [Chytridium lagenaria]
MTTRPGEDRRLVMLRGLLKLEDNKKCFDCPSRSPSFVNLSAGTFVCSRCSGHLMAMNFRVKSVSASIFTKEEIESLALGGNAAAKQVYLASWTPASFPEPLRLDDEGIVEFMKLKYLQKKWYREPVQQNRGLKGSMSTLNMKFAPTAVVMVDTPVETKDEDGFFAGPGVPQHAPRRSSMSTPKTPAANDLLDLVDLSQPAAASPATYLKQCLLGLRISPTLEPTYPHPLPPTTLVTPSISPVPSFCLFQASSSPSATAQEVSDDPYAAFRGLDAETARTAPSTFTSPGGIVWGSVQKVEEEEVVIDPSDPYAAFRGAFTYQEPKAFVNNVRRRSSVAAMPAAPSWATFQNPPTVTANANAGWADFGAFSNAPSSNAAPAAEKGREILRVLVMVASTPKVDAKASPQIRMRFK